MTAPTGRVVIRGLRACSSAGRALESHSRGQRFDPVQVHQPKREGADHTLPPCEPQVVAVRPSVGIVAEVKALKASTRISSLGEELAVEVSGPGGAPVILCVHGYPDTRRVWDGVAGLLDTTFRVVRYDVRGAGESSTPKDDSGFRLEALAADLGAVAKHFGGGVPVHLVGHDWGGIQAWEALADPELAPLFASFTVISGPCLDHIGFWLRDALAIRGLRARLKQAARSWYVAAFHLPNAGEKAKRTILRHGAAFGIHDGGHIPPTLGDDAARGTALYRANMRRRLFTPRPRPIRMPVLQLVPTRDAYVTPVLAEPAEAWVDELYRRDLDGGHWAVRSSPGEVASHVEAFVRYVASARTLGAEVFANARVKARR